MPTPGHPRKALWTPWQEPPNGSLASGMALLDGSWTRSQVLVIHHPSTLERRRRASVGHGALPSDERRACPVTRQRRSTQGLVDRLVPLEDEKLRRPLRSIAREQPRGGSRRARDPCVGGLGRHRPVPVRSGGLGRFASCERRRRRPACDELLNVGGCSPTPTDPSNHSPSGARPAPLTHPGLFRRAMAVQGQAFNPNHSHGEWTTRLGTLALKTGFQDSLVAISQPVWDSIPNGAAFSQRSDTKETR